MTCFERSSPSRRLSRLMAWTSLASASLIGLGATSSPAVAQKVSSQEGDLAAAGFIVRQADTPKRQTMLQQLPKKKLIERTHNGMTHYVYADPKGCKCLYVGNQQAFQAYSQQQQLQKISNQQQDIAENYSNPTWDWGEWGDGFGPGWAYGPGFGW